MDEKTPVNHDEMPPQPNFDDPRFIINDAAVFINYRNVPGIETPDQADVLKNIVDAHDLILFAESSLQAELEVDQQKLEDQLIKYRQEYQSHVEALQQAGVDIDLDELFTTQAQLREAALNMSIMPTFQEKDNPTS